MEGTKSSDETQALILLNQCKAEIKKLETRLEQQRQLQVTLERNLISIRTKIAAISHLPQELLIPIFAEAKAQDPMTIGSILLVCRQWNQTATSSLKLWTTISLGLSAEPMSIARQIGYAKACIRYSEPLPLDIQLFLPLEDELWYNMARKLISTRNPTFVEPLSGLYADLRQFFLNNCDKLRKLWPYQEVNEAVRAFMSTIAGQNGINMLRIRSMALSFASKHFSDWLEYETFYYPTPLLEEIKIMAMDEPWNLNPIFIHPCPKLTSFSCNYHFPVEKLLLRDEQLRRFGRSLSQEATFSKLLPSDRITRDLKYLFIEFPSLMDLEVPIQPLIFPLLEELAISADCSPQVIQAPKLTTLRLLGTRSRNLFLKQTPQFPLLKRLHLWAYEVDLK